MSPESVIEIREELTRLKDEVQSLRLAFEKFLSRQEQICQGHKDKLHDLEHSVYGNGKPGLKSSVAAQDVEIAKLGMQMKVVIGAMGFVATTVGALVLAAVWKVIAK